jgi:hypothetical protein
MRPGPLDQPLDAGKARGLPRKVRQRESAVRS